MDSVAIRTQLAQLRQKKNETLASYTLWFEELANQVQDYGEEQITMIYTDGMTPGHREAIVMAMPGELSKSHTSVTVCMAR